MRLSLSSAQVTSHPLGSTFSPGQKSIFQVDWGSANAMFKLYSVERMQGMRGARGKREME